jgi:hypothetical protein
MVTARCRLKGFIAIGSSTTAGDVILYDANTYSASQWGNVILRFALPGNQNNTITFQLPDAGILCNYGIVAIVPGTLLANAASLTVLYG